MRILLNMYVKNCIGLNNWKNAVTVPLYKRKANKNECKDYREIRLLNMSVKMFDRILIETVEEVTLSKIWEVQCDFFLCQAECIN